MANSGTRPAPGITIVKWNDVQVVVDSGPSKGMAAVLQEGPLLIGSGEDCDLKLQDDTVSARHCELRKAGDVVVVRDLQSTNGVMLDGVRVTEAFPKIGSKLKLGQTQLALKRQHGREVTLSKTNHFGGLYGESPLMRALFAQLEPIATSSAPLLVEGETGTGKDVTAEAVHRASGRADGPFVLFDCGAVAANLMEAELFGYEKGAFTGANASREGMAEAADGGTLVLDEVGELPLELQPKLLRLVERKEVRRVGANAQKLVDVRIIACTHRSLRSLVNEGRFREDLYYRLSAFRVRIPSLRERPEDLAGLVDRLLESHGTRQRFQDLPDTTQALLRSHQWPGNIRELRNVVERLLAFPVAPAVGLIEGEALAPAERPEVQLLPLSTARENAQNEFERRYLKALLERSEGSISEGARMAGVSRQFLQRLLRKHGLR